MGRKIGRTPPSRSTQLKVFAGIFQKSFRFEIEARFIFRYLVNVLGKLVANLKIL